MILSRTRWLQIAGAIGVLGASILPAWRQAATACEECGFFDLSVDGDGTFAAVAGDIGCVEISYRDGRRGAQFRLPELRSVFEADVLTDGRLFVRGSERGEDQDAGEEWLAATLRWRSPSHATPRAATRETPEDSRRPVYGSEFFKGRRVLLSLDRRSVISLDDEDGRGIRITPLEVGRKPTMIETAIDVALPIAIDTFSDPRVFVSHAASGSVVALDSETGKELWRTTPGRHASKSRAGALRESRCVVQMVAKWKVGVVVCEYEILVGGPEQEATGPRTRGIAALGIESGNVIWERQLAKGEQCELARHGDHILVADTRRVVSLDSRSGEMIAWKPLLCAVLAIATSDDGSIVATFGVDSRVRWIDWAEATPFGPDYDE